MKKITYIFGLVALLLFGACQNDRITFDGPAEVAFNGESNQFFYISEGPSKTFNLQLATTRLLTEDKQVNFIITTDSITSAGVQFQFPSSVIMKAGSYTVDIPLTVLYDGMTRIGEAYSFEVAIDQNSAAPLAPYAQTMKVFFTRVYPLNLDAFTGIASCIESVVANGETTFGEPYDIEFEKKDDQTLIMKGFWEVTADMTEHTYEIPIKFDQNAGTVTIDAINLGTFQLDNTGTLYNVRIYGTSRTPNSSIKGTYDQLTKKVSFSYYFFFQEIGATMASEYPYVNYASITMK